MSLSLIPALRKRLAVSRLASCFPRSIPRSIPRSMPRSSPMTIPSLRALLMKYSSTNVNGYIVSPPCASLTSSANFCCKALSLRFTARAMKLKMSLRSSTPQPLEASRRVSCNRYTNFFSSLLFPLRPIVFLTA